MKLEALRRFLYELDAALAAVHPVDRAQIIMDLKSQVEATAAREPDRPIESILQNLGDPGFVANRILMERGLSPGSPSRSQWALGMVKWLSLGLLGSSVVLALLVVFLVSQFSPILEIDEGAGRVKILGGLIDIQHSLEPEESQDGQEEPLADPQEAPQSLTEFQGSLDWDLKENPQIEVHFADGNIEFRTSESMQVRWTCKVEGALHDVEEAQFDPQLNLLDLSKVKGVTCEIDIPARLSLVAKGSEGLVTLQKPKFLADVRISNGKIDFIEAEGVPYVFQIEVGTGLKDSFESSKDPKALPIQLKANTGEIRHHRSAR